MTTFTPDPLATRYHFEIVNGNSFAEIATTLGVSRSAISQKWELSKEVC